MTREARFKKTLEGLNDKQIWDVLCRCSRRNNSNFLAYFGDYIRCKYQNVFRRWAIRYIMGNIRFGDSIGDLITNK